MSTRICRRNGGRWQLAVGSGQLANFSCANILMYYEYTNGYIQVYLSLENRKSRKLPKTLLFALVSVRNEFYKIQYIPNTIIISLLVASLKVWQSLKIAPHFLLFPFHCFLSHEVGMVLTLKMPAEGQNFLCFYAFGAPFVYTNFYCRLTTFCCMYVCMYSFTNVAEAKLVGVGCL